MADARVALGHVRVLFSEKAEAVQVSQGRVRTLYSFTAERGELSAARVRSLWGDSGAVDGQVSQARARVLIKFGAETRRLRAWTFPQDQHDFYVLSLGRTRTIVFDYLTRAWSVWDTHNMTTWRTSDGMAWEKDNIAGDALIGLLWNVNADERRDDAPSGDLSEEYPIRTIVSGMIPLRGRYNLSCYRATLTVAQGSPIEPGVGISLRTSVDEGLSWTEHGFLLLDEAGKKYDISWVGLGLIEEPGMIFEFTDTGYTRRINALDIDLGDDEEGSVSAD